MGVRAADRADPAARWRGGRLARLLAATTLAIFPNNLTPDDGAAGSRDAHPGTVRRAVAFIESHPDRDLGIADIAAAAHVSARALQLAFRRHLATTPMAYLRRVRLDRAHADLVKATRGDEENVTFIATRWGFAHPSRFTALYRTAYGQTPSETLLGLSTRHSTRSGAARPDRR